VLDFDGDLYGREVSVDVQHRIRGQAVFPSVGELITQMHQDIAQARRLLARPQGVARGRGSAGQTA
jgi:riboflavin kinase/FMN adenylyltransferase